MLPSAEPSSQTIREVPISAKAIAFIVALAALLTAAPASAHPHQYMPEVGPHAARTVRHWEREQRWKAKYTPYYGCTLGGCGWWAIKPWSVNCESGGGAVSDNLYGNVETYVPGMTRREQDLAAHKILESAGYWNGWLRWESGCAGWPG